MWRAEGSVLGWSVWEACTTDFHSVERHIRRTGSPSYKFSPADWKSGVPVLAARRGGLRQLTLFRSVGMVLLPVASRIVDE